MNVLLFSKLLLISSLSLLFAGNAFAAEPVAEPEVELVAVAVNPEGTVALCACKRGDQFKMFWYYSNFTIQNGSPGITESVQDGTVISYSRPVVVKNLSRQNCKPAVIAFNEIAKSTR